MSGSLIPNAKQQFLDANGNPLAGGFVYYYIPGTTTFKNTYQNSALTILNTNPIILDSAGEAIIYGNGSYRQIVTDVNGNLIWDQTTVVPITISDVVTFYSESNGSSLIGYTQGSANAVSRTVQNKLQESVSVLDFGAVGDGVADDTASIQAAINSLSSGNLYFPIGTYKVTSTISITAPIQLIGEGWSVISSDVFGSSQWTYGTGSATYGTIIRSTVTSGYAFTFNNSSVVAYGLKNICIIGPGTGTSTGVQLGTSTRANEWTVFDNVMVCNFYNGYEINFTLESSLGIKTRGCYNGIKLQNNVNNCAFPSWEVTSSSSVGLFLQNCVQNNFYDGVMQGNTGIFLINADRTVEVNSFYGAYFENCTTTYGVYVGTNTSIGSTAVASCSFYGIRMSSDVNNSFTFDYSYGSGIFESRIFNGAINILPNAVGTNLIGVSNVGVSDAGAGTILIDANYGGIDIGAGGLILGTSSLGRARLAFGQTTTPAAPTVGGVLYVKVVGGKNQLFMRFPTGAEVFIVTEP